MSHAIARTFASVPTAAPRAPLQQRRQREGTVQGRIAASAVPRRTGAAPANNPTASKLLHKQSPTVSFESSIIVGNNTGSGRRSLPVTKYGARSMEYSADGMGCVAHDPQLAAYEAHLKYRWKVFNETKEAIVAAEGSMDAFSKGYEKFGFNKTPSGDVVYREWAPAAQAAALIGDFNGWNPDANPMSKDEYGVWELVLPAGSIPHGSRVKIRLLRFNDGGWVDRIPAWIKMSVQEPGVMGAKYDGVYWDPPAGEKYVPQNPRPVRPSASRIYEAHVGMSGSEPKVNSYREFADDVLPRVKTSGYNTVQLMAVMEHAYYGSFGYHVTSPYAVSSRCGNPEDLKYLVDKAHGLGLRVLLDVVHCHASCNVDDGIAGYDFGQQTEDSYFGTGEAGYHWLWDSRLYNYSNWEVQRYLMSNLRYWVEEYGFDGFRFDGVTSMLYHHHGLEMAFSGDYHQYFGLETNVAAVSYLMLANDLLHTLYPGIEVIAEDVSGMPTLCRPVTEGGVGFDARLAMSIPDLWVRMLRASREDGVRDEDWNMHEIVSTLCNRRYTEKAVGYAECHDQSIVGDKTTAFWLMDAEMYTDMSTFEKATPGIDRGMALHKMIRLITMAIGGEGYLNFMGNEFGHPEWVDFPREGNGWSHDYCRRQWELADTEYLRYAQLGAFDRAMMELDEEHHFLGHEHQLVTSADDDRKLIVAERGPLLFVFNFHPTATYEGLEVGVGMAGKYRICLDTDEFRFGGNGRVGHDADHFTTPGGPKTWVGQYPQEPRPCMMYVKAAPRSAQVYMKIEEVAKVHDFSGLQSNVRMVPESSLMGGTPQPLTPPSQQQKEQEQRGDYSYGGGGQQGEPPRRSKHDHDELYDPENTPRRIPPPYR